MHTGDLFADATPSPRPRPSAAADEPGPGPLSPEALGEAERACRRCGLWEHATQVVGGEGPRPAQLMVVGEQPGNDEDLAGRPFVGPAGRLLDDALRSAGVPRGELFVTNAVKHFKWVAQGRRRLHQKPGVTEVRACNVWLAEEVRQVAPQLILCLGATAGQAVVGRDFKVTRDRGRVLQSPLGRAYATIHPSAILRMPDREVQAAALRQFVLELHEAWALARGQGPTAPGPGLGAAADGGARP